MSLSPDLDDSPTPSPETDPETPPQVWVADQPARVRRGMGWGRPSTTQPDSDDEPAASSSASDPDDSPELSAEPRETPSQKTGASRASSPGSRKALEPVVAMAVETATTTAAGMLARDDYDLAVGLYRADDQDVEGISKPAAGLIARRSGDALGAATPDVTDGIALAIALAAYVAKQLQRFARARHLRAQNADLGQGGQPVVPTPDVDDETATAAAQL